MVLGFATNCMLYLSIGRAKYSYVGCHSDHPVSLVCYPLVSWTGAAGAGWPECGQRSLLTAGSLVRVYLGKENTVLTKCFSLGPSSPSSLPTDLHYSSKYDPFTHLTLHVGFSTVSHFYRKRPVGQLPA